MQQVNISVINKFLIEFKENSELQVVSFDSNNHPDIAQKTERQLIYQWCDNLDYGFQTDKSNGKITITIFKNKSEIKVIPKTPTDEDLKCFIKDFKLPIPVNRNPHFAYFIDLYDDTLQTKKKYQLLIDAINHPEIGNSTIKSYSFQLADLIGDAIKKSPDYETFANSKEYVTKNGVTKKNDIYTKCLKEKVYVSLDITTANFTALKFVNSSLVLGCKTWDELIRKFTSIEYFIQSKHFRQVVFGRIGAVMKRVSSIQKYLTAELSQQLKERVNIEHVSNDEIVINSSFDTFGKDIELCWDCIKMLPEGMQSWKVIPFSLVQLGKSEAVIKKYLLTNVTEIRHIDKDFYAQCFKHHTNQSLTPTDMKFMSQHGKLCSFEETLF